MSQIRSALSMLIALVGPVLLMLLGAVMALFLFAGEGSGRDSRALPAHAGQAYFSNDGESIHVVPNLEKANDVKTLVIHGVGGRELATARIFQLGGVWLEAPKSDRIRFVVDRQGSKSVGVGLGVGRIRLHAVARADGSSEYLFVENETSKIMNAYFIDTEGRVFSKSSPDHVDEYFRSPRRIGEAGGNPEPNQDPASVGTRQEPAISSYPGKLQP